MTAKTSRWSRLDNAAKIFPSSTSRRDSKVFRFYCQLDRPVEPEHLTLAVEQVLAHFPFYRCTMRKGMFWYFLEESRKFPRVAQESEPPCAQKAHPDRHDLLLSVSYYRCRINVEMYHALADGTGALDFLKALVCRYLVLCHPQLAGEEPQFDGSLQERMADSFRQHYRGEKMARRGFHLQPAAYHLSGRKLPEDRLQLVEGVASASQVAAAAKARGATVGMYLCAVFQQAIYRQMPASQTKRPVVVSMPINLRNFFDSRTARNFFSVMPLSRNFSQQSGELEDILEQVKEDFRRELEPQRVAQRVEELCRLEYNLFTRMVPLVLKDVVMMCGNKLFNRSVTGAISNLGRVSFPAAFQPYIQRMGAFNSTSRIHLCLCSCGDAMTFGFATPFSGSGVEVARHFFRILREEGVEITVAANRLE